MNPLEALNWHQATLERTDEMFRKLVRLEPTLESGSDPEEMTDTERLDWFGEYCNLDKSRYQWPTTTTNGKFVLYDLLGQVTKENSIRDAIDSAMQKWKEANGGY